jgi:membrane associated rhomboid family serine protease
MFFLGIDRRLDGPRLVGRCLAVLLLLSFLASRRIGVNALAQLAGVTPANWFQPDPGALPAPLTILLGPFLHANWGHLASNLLFFLVVARNLEARLGSLPFLLAFFASGGVGFAAHALAFPASSAAVIGASGAIAGLLGIYWVWFPDHQLRFALKRHMPAASFDLRAPIAALILLWLASQVLVGIPEMLAGTSPVAVMAHLGGFAFGYLFALLRRKPLRSRFRTVRGGPWND